MNDLNENLIDNFGRQFSYLRLSITDVCNFRCSYCLPNGYIKTDQSFLNANEIENLVTAFSDIGISKIRLTGGEPTVRKDFLEIASRIAKIPKIKKLALTTNGYSLKKYASDFANAGINAINISIDSLNAQNFKEITDHDKLSLILGGVDEIIKAGIKNVKINTVLLKGLNDNELDDFINFVQYKPLTLRFIELMQTGDNLEYFNKHHLKSDIIKNKLLEKGWQAVDREADAGPATEYQNANSQGKIGIIAPYSKGFCDSCNRLRVTARGNLRLCLFGDGSYSLKPLLQHKDQKEELMETIYKTLNLKNPSHLLQLGKTGMINNLSSLGG